MFLCVTHFCADLQSYRHQSEFWEMTSCWSDHFWASLDICAEIIASQWWNYQKKKRLTNGDTNPSVLSHTRKWKDVLQLSTNVTVSIPWKTEVRLWLILNLTVKLVSTSCCNLTAWQTQSCHSPAFLCVVLESPYGGNDKHSSTQTLLGCVSDSPGGDYKRCSAWSSEGIILLENGIPHINCAWQIKGRKGWETWGPSVIMPLVQHCSRQQD